MTEWEPGDLVSALQSGSGGRSPLGRDKIVYLLVCWDLPGQTEPVAVAPPSPLIFSG